jgi:hypothetical protein
MTFGNQWMARLVLLAAVAGCGGREADVVAEPPVPLTELGVQFIAAYCAEIYLCCPAASRVQQLVVGTDEASCRLQLAPAGAALQAAMSDEVAGGRVTYDGAKMGECHPRLHGAHV